jgi:MoxR-like ATPase
VTIEGETRPLPDHFFVIATQNPVTQAGTFPLPESQLDRFLMRIELGYPEAAAEREMLRGADINGRLHRLEAAMTPADLRGLQEAASRVRASDMLLDYLQRLTEATRSSSDFAYGLSPRGALALLACARAWAFMEGRAHVVPEDVQAVLVPVCGHRLRAATEFHGDGTALAERLLTRVDVFA